MKIISLIIAVVILAIGASLLANMYTNARYEIDESITQENIEDIYGNTLDRVASLYDASSQLEIQEQVNKLRNNIPQNIGILKLDQRDKGVEYSSYGVKYFSYQQEPYPHSFYYTNSSMNSIPNSIRGYVENKQGERIDVLKYKRIIVKEGKELDIQLVIDYKRLLELLNSQ